MEENLGKEVRIKGGLCIDTVSFFQNIDIYPDLRMSTKIPKNTRF